MKDEGKTPEDQRSWREDEFIRRKVEGGRMNEEGEKWREEPY
jgi:hypothetical protein